MLTEVTLLQVGFFRGISYIAFFRYTVAAFLNLQYGDRDDGCGLLPGAQPPGAQLPAARLAGAGQAKQPTGRQACDSILDDTDMRLSVGGCIGGLLVLLTLLHVASFLALARHTRRH